VSLWRARRRYPPRGVCVAGILGMERRKTEVCISHLSLDLRDVPTSPIGLIGKTLSDAPTCGREEDIATIGVRADIQPME
jgi:hypothetical protein